MGMNKALLKAIDQEEKAFYESVKERVIIDFIVDNWFIFTEKKGSVYACLRGTHQLEGQELIDLLGLENILVKKVEKKQIVAVCLAGTKSELFKEACSFASKHKGSVTAFFILGKSALVMTNQYELRPEGNFLHKLEGRDRINDMYWACVEDVKTTLRVY